MSKFGDFFSMTRRERVGAIVVALLIVIVMASIYLIRSCSSQKVCEVPVSGMEQFEQETDSAVQQIPYKAKKAKKEKRQTVKEAKSKGEKNKSPKKQEKKKSASEPNRSLDPVPTF